MIPRLASFHLDGRVCGCCHLVGSFPPRLIPLPSEHSNVDSISWYHWERSFWSPWIIRCGTSHPGSDFCLLSVGHSYLETYGLCSMITPYILLLPSLITQTDIPAEAGEPFSIWFPKHKTWKTKDKT